MKYLLRRFGNWFAIALLVLTTLGGCNIATVNKSNPLGISDRSNERIIIGTTSKVRTLDPADANEFFISNALTSVLVKILSEIIRSSGKLSVFRYSEYSLRVSCSALNFFKSTPAIFCALTSRQKESRIKAAKKVEKFFFFTGWFLLLCMKILFPTDANNAKRVVKFYSCL